MKNREQIHQRLIRVLRSYGLIGLVKGCRSLILRWVSARRYKRELVGRELIYREKLAAQSPQDGLIEIDVLAHRMKVFSDDPGISKDLVIDGIREVGATRLMENLLRGDMTVIEIGANIGYYLLLEATRLGPGSRILAFEPHPANIRLCQLNLDLNGVADRASLYQRAVSDRSGEAVLR